MKVAELGEFGLIERLADLVRDTRPEAAIWLQLGIGDDCAAWRWDSGLQLATVDTLIEGVHFRRELTDWESLGWKALAVNLSDIAAMGGEPRYALAALALPGATEVDDVVALYGGMLELAAATGTVLAGGNISAAPQVSITLTVIGAASAGKMLTRGGARPGELVAVTGHPGSAAAGLALLKEPGNIPPEIGERLSRAWRRPEPRIAVGKALLKRGIRTAIDISDGLGRDLEHICTQSGVGARIRLGELPLDEGVREYFGERAAALALGGGEDYELLFTGSEPAIKEVQADVDISVTIIGEIAAGGGVIVIDREGRESFPAAKGWDHFGGE